MTRSSTEIKKEIETLQNKMTARVDHLADRLSPSRLVGEAADAFARNPQENMEKVFETARRHPVATTMVGLAAAAVAVAASGKAPSTKQAIDAAGRVRDRAWSEASNLSAKTTASAKRVRKAAVENVDQFVEQTERYADEAMDASDRVVDTTRDFMTDAVQTASDYARVNPVATGAFAIAAGALMAGFMTSRSPYDDETAHGENNNGLEDRHKVKVSQARKSTRAKSIPNKVTKQMKPVTKTGGDAAKKTAAAKSRSTKNSKTRVATSKARQSAASKVSPSRKSVSTKNVAVLGESAG